MPSGGARPGAGRPKGSRSSPIAAQARKQAAETGELPHQWLLRVMRGEPIKHKVVVEAADKRGVVRQVVREEMIYPDFATRLEAAKSCSAFFAPRLAAQAIRADMQDGAIAAALLSLAHKLPV